MATIEMINGKKYKGSNGKLKVVSYKTHASMRKVIDYIYQDAKTQMILKQGLRCSPDTAYKEMMLTKQMYGKAMEDGKRRMVVHFVQSFKPGETTPETAAEIAKQLLTDSMFDGFQIAFATHVDKEHIHTHFVINTVNQDNGKMWHMAKEDLQHLKDLSDALCQAHGLSVISRNGVRQPHKSYGQYKAEENGTGYIKETKMAVDNVLKLALSKQEFVEKMKELGYEVTWTDTRKYVTFKTPDGHTVRDSRLWPKGKYTKESFEERFKQNQQYMDNKMQKLQEDQNAAETEVDQMIAGAGVLFRLMVNMGKQNQYPYQKQAKRDSLKSDNVEAKRERMQESKKGYGIDWEVT